MKLKVTVNQVPYEVEVEVDETPAGLPPVYIGGGSGAPAAAAVSSGSASGNAVTAPLAGSVRKILVDQGQSVNAGDVVAVLEAMKMETEITAPKSGKVAKILVEVGAAVQGGDPIIDIDPA
ncbi:MAG: biotin/lipoyl-binding protein [Propionibacteriaceae bacterium]|jgi:methylmalonyl-CoA carboxyltransferase small subunit|nr:biotin/lipoyl-binding protein [Propionibacteriaceae bacterium]